MAVPKLGNVKGSVARVGFRKMISRFRMICFGIIFPSPKAILHLVWGVRDSWIPILENYLCAAISLGFFLYNITMRNQ